MQISLPIWQESFRIAPEAYDKLRSQVQNGLDRALLILERYRGTKDNALYDLFTATLDELYPDVKLLVLATGSHWFEEQSLKLQVAAEIVAWEEPNYYPTMLVDLAGCLGGC